MTGTDQILIHTRSKIFKPVPKNFWKHRRFKLMAFLRQSEEKNDDDSLYGKSGDEDDRLRKEYHYLAQQN